MHLLGIQKIKGIYYLCFKHVWVFEICESVKDVPVYTNKSDGRLSHKAAVKTRRVENSKLN